MYIGREGQWLWILHRVTGIGVLFFLILHILDTALVLLGPDAYNHVVDLYRHPVIRISEIALFGAVLFHAINGVRVIIVDFWPEAPRYHRQIATIAIILFVISFIPVALTMLGDMLS